MPFARLAPLPLLVLGLVLSGSAVAQAQCEPPRRVRRVEPGRARPVRGVIPRRAIRPSRPRTIHVRPLRPRPTTSRRNISARVVFRSESVIVVRDGVREERSCETGRTTDRPRVETWRRAQRTGAVAETGRRARPAGVSSPQRRHPVRSTRSDVSRSGTGRTARLREPDDPVAALAARLLRLLRIADLEDALRATRWVEGDPRRERALQEALFARFPSPELLQSSAAGLRAMAHCQDPGPRDTLLRIFGGARPTD